MENAPKGLRLHIGVYGRRNVGKSSLLNALVNQDVSIVSDVAGTTTDVVEKVMEFKPIGPVVFIDTAGIDDSGELGEARIARTIQALERTELGVLVVGEQWGDYEQRLSELFEERDIPFVVAANKSDLFDADRLAAVRDAVNAPVISTNAPQGEGIERLKQSIVEVCPAEFLEPTTIVGDLIAPGDIVVLVTPIDLEAPKGRLILPQVQTLRDVLDNDGFAIVTKESELARALESLKTSPRLVVTDSQAFDTVSKIVPDEVLLTGFSVLYARIKGDLKELVAGVRAIERLSDGDRVLIAEACSHHPVEDDIGREKIPRWLREHSGRDIDIDVVAGRDFPDDLSKYSLIIHCGSCVFNRKALLSRIEKARVEGVPITNYGIAIAFFTGMLDRALRPFNLSTV
jgi:[FeFe] hydrogenase H-cluster maturation GTPase HydF